MNIDINLLPEELRPKPLIRTRSLVVIALILALGYGCFYFAQARSDAQSQATELEDSIALMKQQTTNLIKNPEATQLINSIKQLNAVKENYDSFVSSKVMWGQALETVYRLVPSGVNIASITQKGNSLVITGTASSYTKVADFGLALDSTPNFALLGLPSLSSSTDFSLTISVAPGGGR